MSRFFTKTLSALTPYTPGEQPQDMKYVKLNTNESPFEPSQRAWDIARENERALNLYSDPKCTLVIKKLAEFYGVSEDELILGNGSDELLFFSFKAFCDETRPAVFPDITYGFYPVFAEINRVPYKEIPLREDFSVNASDYGERGNTIFIANPNAPTGRMLPVCEIEELVRSHPEDVIVIDEAYVDFGGESCIPLTRKYDNILVIQTFSKSRSLAGARIGFAIGSKGLIQDLNTVKYSFNPYNINSMTLSIAYGVLCDEETVRKNCRTVMENRAYTVEKLKELEFEVIDSCANFIFARTDKLEGGRLYEELKKNGVLVRHFTKERISDYNRITIGTREQMDFFINKVKEILLTTA